MSCLPQLFTASKSQHLPQTTKIGGMFAINLRSAYFTNLKQGASISDGKKQKSSSYSLQGKRYRSWTNRQESFRTSKSGNKSFYKQKSNFEEAGIEETGHTFNNLSNKISHQSEIEAISNFNILKRNAFQSLHLSKKMLQLSQNQMKLIKSQLLAFSQSIANDLQTFKASFSANCSNLTKEFRQERRSMLGENKTISQQLVYLSEQMSTSKQICGQLRGKFGKLTHQFI